jgi:protochlorophyllide reductase
MSTVFLAMYFANQMRSRQVAEPLKTVIITGGSRGIGLAAAKQLAATGRWNVVLACRSLVQAEEAIKGITDGREYVSAVELDLSKLASVRRFTSLWGDRSLHCLALNAGIHGGSKTMPEWSEDGYELTVATNHIGHFLLTSLLRKNVEKARAGRIVYVASSRKFPASS